VPDGGATAKAIDYSLNHWTVLTRNLLDGAVPLDNNHLENLVRPWAMGRNKAKSAFMRSSGGGLGLAALDGQASEQRDHFT
jgi:hypothetical protein